MTPPSSLSVRDLELEFLQKQFLPNWPVAAENLIRPPLQFSGAIDYNVNYAGKTWSRFSPDPSAASYVNAILRGLVDLANLVGGQTYTGVWEIANDTSNVVTVAIDWTDLGETRRDMQPGETAIVSATASRSKYTATYRFTDLQIVNYQDLDISILFCCSSALIGAVDNPVPFDGDTPDDALYTYNWTGEPNNSTSVKNVRPEHYPITLLRQMYYEKNSTLKPSEQYSISDHMYNFFKAQYRQQIVQ